MEWIDVKDKPVEDGAVLVFDAQYGDGNIHKAHCIGGDHILDDGLYANRLYKVTHWLKIEPPKEK